MATAQQQPGLGQRIVGSAKGLACSTLFGDSEIEAELRDPLNNIKIFAAPQSSGQDVNRDFTTTRRATPRLSEGFRGDFTKDVDLDPDFEAFARRTDSIVVAPRKSARIETKPARKAVLVCDFSRRQQVAKSHEVLCGSSPESIMRGLSWGQTQTEYYASSGPERIPIHHEWSRRNLESATVDQREKVSMALPDMESTWETSQSAAVDRLKQLSAQLTEAATAPPVTRTMQRDWVPADLHWEEIQNEQMRQQLRVPERRLQYERTGANQEDHPMRNFYCRRLSCHRRLVMQEASLDLNCQTRCCVHTGCGYVSQTTAGWERHCATEHNHSQEIDGEQSCCPHCQSVEDTH